MPDAGLVRKRRSHGLLAVVVVILAIVATEFALIAAQNAPRPGLPLSALRSVIPTATDGKPTLIWTNAGPHPEGRPADLAAHALLLAAACTGGGAVSITLSDRSSVALDCSRPATLGPVRLDRATFTTSTIAVQASSGNPRYVVELIATDA